MEFWNGLILIYQFNPPNTNNFLFQCWQNFWVAAVAGRTDKNDLVPQCPLDTVHDTLHPTGNKVTNIRCSNTNRPRMEKIFTPISSLSPLLLKWDNDKDITEHHLVNGYSFSNTSPQPSDYEEWEYFKGLSVLCNSNNSAIHYCLSPL